MSEELPKQYDAKTTDGKWYAFWEEKGFFQPNQGDAAYCIVIPPPNVTGVLHMGHALGDTLQDILIRWKRMCGFKTLWVPGTDHAGISTQTVVEKQLIATTGKRRKDFSREAFLEEVWKWKTKCENTIISQIKSLGCSCDWSKQRFTMDAGCNRAVRIAFKKLYEQGLIYRGKYLVNWDPVTQTALADDEVEHEERESSLWYFKYPLEEGEGYAVVATTRPETMLGDTAVAVSPKDPRYKHLIGKKVLQPLVNRKIPIIADTYVDPEFGSGMVKITPAHDFNDYQIGLQHQLPMINILEPDGRLNDACGEFQGMTREEAREAVIEAMRSKGLLDKVEKHTQRVGLSYRSKAITEPYLSEQWFVKMSAFKSTLKQAVENGAVTLIPETWKSTYFHWIDNLRDWCISRQLWWGHQIPIWYHRNDPTNILCYDGEGLPPEVQQAPDLWVQDEDVLDTWFSAGLWPFSTLGWPDNTELLKTFYPNNVLVTGHDILFFWVARMLLFGHYLLGEFPFPDVVLHGLIYGRSYWRKNPEGGITYVTQEERLSYDLGKTPPKDVFSKWEKLSKSKGNVIDPLEMIAEYGTDATRMALCASATQAPQIDLDRRRFEEFRNFTNKVWNGARFVLMHLDLSPEELARGLDLSLLSLEDHWILTKLHHVIEAVNQQLSSYFFDQAATTAYDFFWKEFCAYYVELVKPVLFGKAGTPAERTNKQKLLVILLCNSLRLLHPMAPFITEELFQLLKTRFPLSHIPSCDAYTRETLTALQSAACIIAPYPQPHSPTLLDPQALAQFDALERVIYAIRNIRGEMGISPAVVTEVWCIANRNDPLFQLVERHQRLIPALVRVSKVHFSDTEVVLPLASLAMVEGMKIIVPLPQELQLKEKERLEKERERLLKQLEGLRHQLSNPEFVEKAPPPLVEKQQKLLEQLTQELTLLQQKIETNC